MAEPNGDPYGHHCQPGSPPTGWWAEHPESSHKTTQRRTALTQYGEEIPVEELEQEHASELPGRELLMGISLLGIPLLGIADLSAVVNTAGPYWLAAL